MLDVVGLREAMSSPDLVTLSPTLTINVASIQAQTALKILAWRDRHLTNSKDAPDLHDVLWAGSRGPYAEEMWAAPDALEACGYVLDLAGAYLLGKTCAENFTAARAQAVVDVLDDPTAFARLALQMQHLTASELLDAYGRGFAAGVPKGA
ncbi:hypothetical protein ASG73_00345 [Janibacter sp. Soil728]|uniref:hypothetical protein n=1 Tax=Janibacter sp. Soil728 TaxID=1736393 RepID=UPI0006FAE3F8|nr:hypothetical protein [Janibacter sp. Soil728]KRE38859.1 hypothetical protein ASG73_00345 [Janibacter sp. Soil728]